MRLAHGLCQRLAARTRRPLLVFFLTATHAVTPKRTQHSMRTQPVGRAIPVKRASVQGRGMLIWGESGSRLGGAVRVDCRASRHAKQAASSRVAPSAASSRDEAEGKRAKMNMPKLQMNLRLTGISKKTHVNVCHEGHTVGAGLGEGRG